MKKGDSETPLMVMKESCAPSQRLKDGNKEKFYATSIVLELDGDGVFVRIRSPPLTSCSCPNGCIVCSHDGALLLMIYVMSKLSSENMQFATYA